MAGAKRKHYRVAQKEMRANPKKGVFIPKSQKINYLAVFIVVVLAAFIKGLIMGRLMGGKRVEE